MQLLDSSLLQNWLTQFDPLEIDAAVALVNGLNVISTDDQDADLKAIAMRSYGSVNAPVAVFASREPEFSGGSFTPYFVDGRPRPMPDTSDIGSEGRVARVVRDLSRLSPKIIAHPSFADMKRARPTVILVVDDFAGTGNRLVSFVRWLYNEPHIKSLHSLGCIRFHVIASASTPTASTRLRSDKLIDSFQYNRIARTIATSGWPRELQEAVRAIAVKYGKRTNKRHLSLGYDDSESLTLLSATCPNNVPAILWAGGGRWRPLFPHKQVPDELRRLLVQGERLSLGERLRQQGQTLIAPVLADGSLPSYSQKLVALLAASARFRSPYERSEQLAMILGLPLSEVAILFEHARECDFLDSRGRLTEGGRLEIQRLKRALPKCPKRAPQQVSEFYFPKSIRNQAEI